MHLNSRCIYLLYVNIPCGAKPKALSYIAESFIHDPGRVSKWCDHWGMKLNASKTKTMIVCRLHTMHSQSPPLTISGTVLKESRVFHDSSLLVRSFQSFVLPVLEYCSAVWCSAANTHLKLLDRAVSGAWFLTGGVFEGDIAHRQSVVVLSMLYKSGVTQCTLLMVLYLDCMCQCGLYAVLWSHIGTLMRLLIAEPRSTAGLLFPSQWPSGTILLTPYSMVYDWRVSIAWPMYF